MDALEFYKLLGATLGFFSTGFAIWDRMLRHRPSVSITTESLPARLQLRIRNQAPFDIVIEEITSTSRYYRVLAADTVRGAVFDSLQRPVSVLLGPGEERRLAIVEAQVDGRTGDGAGERFALMVRWTRGDHPLLRPFPVRLWSSPEDIALRKHAADMWAQEQRFRGIKSNQHSAPPEIAPITAAALVSAFRVRLA